MLFVGLVVSYARAFEEAKHLETAISQRFSIRNIESPSFSRAYHDELLAVRDDRIAHVGHDLNDYALTFLRVKAKFATPHPDGTISESVKSWNVGTRARATLACGVEGENHSAALVAHFEALEAEASRRLAVAIVEHDRASIFKLEQEVREGREHTKTLASASYRVPPGLLVIGEEDLVVSLADGTNALPLSFAALKLQYINDEAGDRVECEIYEISAGRKALRSQSGFD